MNTRILSFVSALGLAASAALLAQTAVEPPLRSTFGSGVDYSRGDYGFATDTEVFSVPFEWSHETTMWRFNASIPWLKIKGPATVVGAGVPVRPPGASESGLGDLYASATYRFRNVPGETGVDLTGRVKIPTADEARGLGTGELDYYVQAQLHRSFGALTPFVTAGYRVLGDNALYQLRDGAYAGAGAWFRTSDTTVLGASYDWRERLTPANEQASEVSGYVMHDLSRSWQVLTYTTKGFSNGSPDFGAGLRLNYKF